MAEFFTSIQLWFIELWDTFLMEFNLCFIVDDRWKWFVTGLGNTLKITFYALLIGIAVGTIIAITRASWDKTHLTMRKGFCKFCFSLANWVCKVYLTIIRGTPVMLQIFIIFFIVMGKSDNKVLAGIVAFGINSAAYVAEIIRAGIMSVDDGQTEAGRSLGFNYTQTLSIIVLPQALKNVLPSLANEFIVLLKETAVIGTVGLMDLTKAASTVRATAYITYVPLISSALIYLVLIMFLTWMTGKLERRLRNSER